MLYICLHMLYIYIYIYIYMHVCFTYELSNSCKHFIKSISLSSVHLKRACEALFFKKVEFTRAKYQLLIQVGKNVDYMENLQFSSRAEISSYSVYRVEVLHVSAMSFKEGVYYLAEMKLQLGLMS